MTLNLCQAGHETHDSKLVDTEYGPFWIWDWEKYRGFAGYCPGQDDVSMSLDLYGNWERPDIARMREILIEKPGLVLDFGSHIGWFGVQAADLGCPVTCFDSDPENMRLLHLNMQEHGVASWQEFLTWTADLPPLPSFVRNVRFLKADVESYEWEVVRLTRKLWQNRTIDYGLLEISPVFENRESMMPPPYAELVDELIGYGYQATVYKSEGPWIIAGVDCTFDQENVLFSKL